MNSRVKTVAILATLLLWLIVLGVVWHLRQGPAPNSTTYSGSDDSTSNLVAFEMRYRFHVPGETSRLEVTCLVPKTLEMRQNVVEIDYSIAPEKLRDEGNNRYALFVLNGPLASFDLRIHGKLELLRYDLASALNLRRSGSLRVPELTERERVAFLRPETFLEVDDPAIRAVAERIRGMDEVFASRPTNHDLDVTQVQVDTVRRAHNMVLKLMEYEGPSPADVGAVRALKRGVGDCSEYADLFVTLCRAKGLPARVVEGLITEFVSQPRHSWAEVFLKELGWVPFDPTWSDTRSATPDTLRPVYVYLSNVRNDTTLENYHQCSFMYWGDPVSVKESYRFSRLPTR